VVNTVRAVNARQAIVGAGGHRA